MFNFFKKKNASDVSSIKIAVACSNRGDFEGALRHVDALIAQAPQVALSHRFRGETLFSLRRFDEAIASFERAEATGGAGMEEVFFWKALAHANVGRVDQALSILQGYATNPNRRPELAQKCAAAIQDIKDAVARSRA